MLTDPQLIHHLKTCDKAYNAMAPELGVSVSGLKDRVTRLVTKGLIKREEILGQQMGLSARNKKIAQEREERAKLQTENKDLKAQLDAALQIQHAPKDWTKIPKYHGSGQAVPVVMFSDWNMDEVVRRGEVPGCDNQYNADIARKRATKAAQGAAYMINNSKYLGKIDQAVLWLGGDFISGHIHEELMESNTCSPIKAVTTLAQPALSAAIEHILSQCHLDKLTLICNYGNHSRITPRVRHKTGADHSLEWMMYQALKREWRKEPRLQWEIADAYQIYYDVFDTTIRFHHGDNVNYYGGVGGLSIPMYKAVAQWNTIKHCHLDVVGHYHQRRDLGSVLINGSLVGYGAYSLAIKATYERPQQQFFVIQPNKGKTLAAEIFCE